MLYQVLTVDEVEIEKFLRLVVKVPLQLRNKLWGVLALGCEGVYVF